MNKLKIILGFIVFVALSCLYFFIIKYVAPRFTNSISQENIFAFIAFIIYIVIILPIILIFIDKVNKD